MPIYEYHCPDCGHEWENFEWSSGKFAPEECPECSSRQFYKIFGSKQEIRMDATVMKHELPDPVPPLEEFRGNKRMKQAGKGDNWDKPVAELKNMGFKTDKYGNRHWYEKKKQYFNAGGSRKSSAERNDK